MSSPFYWLLLLASFALMGHFNQAHATHEQIPATEWYKGSYATFTADWTTSKEAAGQTQLQNRNAYGATQSPAWPPCTFSHMEGYSVYGSCGAGVVFVSNVQHEYRCPAGYTIGGNLCTHDAPPPPDCEDKAGQEASAGLYDIGTSPTNSPDPVACDGQCQVVFSGTSPAYTSLQGGTRHYYAIGSYDYTGDECSGGSGIPAAQASPPPDTCGSGQVKGTVNGKTVCVDSSTGTPAPTEPAPAPVTETEQTDPPVTNPDGSTTQTTTRTNSDGSTTTTTTTTNPDGSTTTSSTTTPPTGTSQFDSYCATNPTAPICQGTSACEQNPDGPECKFACEKYPNIISCMEVGEMPEPEQISELTRTLTFTEVTLPKASGCPAPATLSLGGHTISMSFDPICQYASAFYYLVMALAYLSAAYIVFGALRTDPVGA